MKHLWIREETRCAASVPEDDSFSGSDGIVPDQRQKACHGLASINRVQQNSLCASHQLDSFSHFCGGLAVSGANLEIVDVYGSQGFALTAFKSKNLLNQAGNDLARLLR